MMVNNPIVIGRRNDAKQTQNYLLVAWPFAIAAHKRPKITMVQMPNTAPAFAWGMRKFY